MGYGNGEVNNKSYIPEPVPDTSWVGSLIFHLLPGISDDGDKKIFKRFASSLFDFESFRVLFLIQYTFLWLIECTVLVYITPIKGIYIGGLCGRLYVLWSIFLPLVI